MSRRIDIEITSLSGSTATWRAAGAKLPKGSLDASALGVDVTVGQVYRAEIEQTMDSSEVVSLSAPKTASPLDPRNERLTLIAKEDKGPDVTVTYAPKGKGRPRGDRDDRPRGDHPDRPRTPRPEGASDRPRAPRGEGSDKKGPRREGRPERGKRPEGLPQITTHRNALLATLSAENIVIAEQLLRGGLPAVRSAVEEQNKNAIAQGRPTINAESILTAAEAILGSVNLAAWKDRAAAAISLGREVRLRDLRQVVTSSRTVILDDEGKAQVKELKDVLTARIEHLVTNWRSALEKAIESKNADEALRLTATAPDSSAKLSSELAAQISELASQALSAEAAAGAWIATLELAVDSPVRRSIKPAGIPDDEAAKTAAVKNAGAIPAIATLLGMKVPPPPPARPAARRRPTTSRPSR